MTTEGEDPEVLQQQQEATEQLRKLLQELGSPELHVIINDWKATTEHIREVAGFMNSHLGWTLHIFPAWHPFEDGQGDDMVAVFTLMLIGYQDAEKIGNLVYNLGAEWEN